MKTLYDRSLREVLVGKEILIPFKVAVEFGAPLFDSGAIGAVRCVYLRAKAVEVDDDMAVFEVDFFGVPYRLTLPRSYVLEECLPCVGFGCYNEFLNSADIARRLRKELESVKGSGGDGRLAALAEYVWAIEEIRQATVRGDRARREALLRFYGLEPEEGKFDLLWQKALDLAQEVLSDEVVRRPA